MGIFFKKQKKILFNSNKDAIEYWEKEGAHNLNTSEVDKMIDLMIDDVTFNIISDFFCENMEIDNDVRLLDAGCGWGRSLFAIKKKFPMMNVTGVDVTEKLLDLGSNIAKRLNISGINWKHSNLLNLKINDSQYDYIVSTRVLHYIDEPAMAIKELLRVLKPGGVMKVLVPNKLNLLLYFMYHTKLYSPKNVASWFKDCNVEILQSASIGFIPPFKYLRKFTVLSKLDPFFQKIPFINLCGGLAFCIVKKRLLPSETNLTKL